MRGQARSLAGALAGVSLYLGTPAESVAQDFFKLAPKPLAIGHAPWDKTEECTKCHELGGGVQRALCLECHDHRPLRDAIARGRGLHATFKDITCRTCHTDHKGRAASITSWDAIGGRSDFDHEGTGFSLTGAHERVACTRCHTRKLASGRVSYMGLQSTCHGCHKNQDTHRFTSKDLLERCTECHDAEGGSARKMKPGELPFDHAKRSGIALVARHAEVDCVKCHANGSMSMKDARSCSGCHKSPHGQSFRQSNCSKCHAVDAPWAKADFDHDATTFPLRGEHDTARCAKCHVTAGKNPQKDCASCHHDPHRDRFEGMTCETCHGLGGTKSVKLDHAKHTGFPLTAGHKALACRRCHRGSDPRSFEHFVSRDCRDCHAHKEAHQGQFDDKPCTSCHKEAGAIDLVFDHQKDARFALTGFHLALAKKGECAKCHPPGGSEDRPRVTRTGAMRRSGQATVYRTGKLLCVDCHRDSHDGELGRACERCHASSVRFREISFDHDHLSRFPLIGLHAKVECEKCHPSRRYKTNTLECVRCHEDDDPHAGGLGDACETCHEPAKGAPKFRHDAMTSFAITGSHRKVECAHCHREREPGPPPRVGWTAGNTPAPELDRRFPVMGRDCAECHFDVHSGRYGNRCAGCHRTTTFREASRAVHDTGAFRLQGAHDELPCARCHQTNRLLTGLGELCVECHAEDDAHNNSLGPYCGACHQQVEWSPQRFNHAAVGFMLSGSHRIVPCRDCHGIGVYQGTPRACDACHRQRAMTVADPIHGAELTDCSRCHTETAFAPARRYHPWFPLTGAHQAPRCGACHGGGVYAGTPRDCFGCHEKDYADPKTRPNHAAAGFATSCDACHTAIAWQGARYQHRSFILRGAHAVLDCDRCHSAGRFDGAFGGLVIGFDCSACHGAGAPVGRWPADHEERGYPVRCGDCHNELGWKPARAPR